MQRFITVLSVLLVFGCGGDDPTEPTRTDLTGNWLGTYVVDGDAIEVRWSLTDSNPTISGFGTLGADGIALTLNITGSHLEPNVTLSLTGQAFIGELLYQGTVEGTNTINGTITGGGAQLTLIMVRV